MNKLLKKGFLAFFLSVYLRSDDLVTYTIIKEKDLGYQRFLAKKCLRGKVHSPCFAEPKKPKKNFLTQTKVPIITAQAWCKCHGYRVGKNLKTIQNTEIFLLLKSV